LDDVPAVGDLGSAPVTVDAVATVAFAGLDGWGRLVHAEHVWGTVVTIDVRGPGIGVGDGADDEPPCAALADAVSFLHDVDAWFSTFRADSPITALRNGLHELSDMPTVVRDVLDDCERIRLLTNGVFDPWAVPGGVDPSGYVKGWAADIVAEMLIATGYPNVCVNAAGDVACRGEQSPQTPWHVGIRHPGRADQVVRTIVAIDEAVATSGCYERGAHIMNPHARTSEMQLDSATVVGPDGGVADALATALVIAGIDGAQWFAELPGWSAYLVASHQATFFGPAFS
jgi:thiamine biosynthesis lipoprotein